VDSLIAVAALSLGISEIVVVESQRKKISIGWHQD